MKNISVCIFLISFLYFSEIKSQTCSGYFYTDIIFDQNCSAKGSEMIRNDEFANEIKLSKLSKDEYNKLLNNLDIQPEGTGFQNSQNPAKSIAEMVLKGQMIAYSDSSLKYPLNKTQIEDLLWFLLDSNPEVLKSLNFLNFKINSLRLKQDWKLNVETLQFDIQICAMAVTLRNEVFYPSEDPNRTVFGYRYKELFWVKGKL